MGRDIKGVKLRSATEGPRMNREQRRAFERYLASPEGQAAVARVKAQNEANKRAEEAFDLKMRDGDE